jgi:hypothetical protein
MPPLPDGGCWSWPATRSRLAAGARVLSREPGRLALLVRLICLPLGGFDPAAAGIVATRLVHFSISRRLTAALFVELSVEAHERPGVAGPGRPTGRPRGPRRVAIRRRGLAAGPVGMRPRPTGGCSPHATPRDGDDPGFRGPLPTSRVVRPALTLTPSPSSTSRSRTTVHVTDELHRAHRALGSSWDLGQATSPRRRRDPARPQGGGCCRSAESRTRRDLALLLEARTCCRAGSCKSTARDTSSPPAHLQTLERTQSRRFAGRSARPATSRAGMPESACRSPAAAGGDSRGGLRSRSHARCVDVSHIIAARCERREHAVDPPERPRPRGTSTYGLTDPRTAEHTVELVRGSWPCWSCTAREPSPSTGDAAGGAVAGGRRVGAGERRGRGHGHEEYG